MQYGHLGYDNLKLLNDKSMVNGMSANTKELFDRNCEGCAIGEQNNTGQLLEPFHSDICGHMNVDSVGGSKLFTIYYRIHDQAEI